jgi:polysaccharide deacetylase family protein (PEP-CTERM system associated)
MSERRPIALSFDVEDWFCVRNMRQTIAREDWDRCESRIRVGTDFILKELSLRNRTATFFILGWIAERFPGLVREIASAGHEIGSHGYAHDPIDCLRPEEFALDLSRSREVLRSLSRQPIAGFRAPSFSVTKKTWWALAEIARQGFTYDSSIFPIRHPDYGIPDFPPGIQRIEGLIEVPMTALRLRRFRVPVSGGGYFRVLPYGVSRRLVQAASARQPVVLYFHPWEFDPDQPRQRMPGLKRFRHYTGLGRNREKFRRLLDSFPVEPIERSIRRWLPPEAPAYRMPSR